MNEQSPDTHQQQISKKGPQGKPSRFFIRKLDRKLDLSALSASFSKPSKRNPTVWRPIERKKINQLNDELLEEKTDKNKKVDELQADIKLKVVVADKGSIRAHLTKSIRDQTSDFLQNW
jgi:hypothetical protein